MPHHIHIAYLSNRTLCTVSIQKKKKPHLKKILDSKVKYSESYKNTEVKNACARSLQEHACPSICLFPLLKQLQSRELFSLKILQIVACSQFLLSYRKIWRGI